MVYPRVGKIPYPVAVMFVVLALPVLRLEEETFPAKSAVPVAESLKMVEVFCSKLIQSAKVEVGVLPPSHVPEAFPAHIFCAPSWMIELEAVKGGAAAKVDDPVTVRSPAAFCQVKLALPAKTLVPDQ